MSAARFAHWSGSKDVGRGQLAHLFDLFGYPLCIVAEFSCHEGGDARRDVERGTCVYEQCAGVIGERVGNRHRHFVACREHHMGAAVGQGLVQRRREGGLFGAELGDAAGRKTERIDRRALAIAGE